MKLIYTIIPLSAVAVVGAGCARHESHSAPPPDLPPAKVHVAKAELKELPAITEVTGTIHPVKKARIAGKVMGTITDLPVALGQPVREGEVIAKIAASEISARVLQAKAQLNQAQRDLKRERALLEKNASTPDMVKSLEDRVAMTEAMVREAEVMQGYATITAPFDGVISAKMADVGDLAAPGMPLLEIEATAGFEVRAGIPESLANHLQTGETLSVIVPSIGTEFTGSVRELSSSADANVYTVEARIAVPAGTAVRSGQFARVRVPGQSTQAIFVPASALTTLGQMDRVFVNVENRAVLRLVKPGRRHGEMIEILSGIDAGESVVVDPPATLREGQPLEILP